MLHWTNQYGIFLFLDSNRYTHTYGQYECLCAADAIALLDAGEEDALAQVQAWHAMHKDWLFGHISYDYKNRLEALSSAHPASSGFSLLQFFQPRVVCSIARDSSELKIASVGIRPEDVWKAIRSTVCNEQITPDHQMTVFEKRMDKTAYLDTLHALRQHIIDGDCYEINFCNQAYCADATIDPLLVFRKLNQLSPAPFAAFYKTGLQYLLCASPERYMLRAADALIAQPIKGTAARSVDPDTDQHNKDQLRNSIKEQAENVMIVDLMRNDLARCCRPGSVTVEELFGIYSFPQVHQMISTIKGSLAEGKGFGDIIRCSFPMGSMTGAPKVKVMQLIEQYEGARRELFSGTVGYIAPDGNFDLNVVIRSLFYNEATHYLSYQTGGAITYESIAEQEWEETLLKALALERVVRP